MSDGHHILLPPQRTAIETALATVAELALSPSDLRHLWDAKGCRPDLLPWLSWALSVEAWHEATSIEARRALVLNSMAIHAKKGTPWAIRLLLRSLGFGEVEIVEHIGGQRHNGQVKRNGIHTRQPWATSWATYLLIFERPISNQQATRIRNLLPAVAPARCHLTGLRYTAVAHTHNGAIQRNGAYNRGLA